MDFTPDRVNKLLALGTRCVSWKDGRGGQIASRMNPRVVSDSGDRSWAGLCRWGAQWKQDLRRSASKGSEGPGCVWACAQGQQYEAYFHLGNPHTYSQKPLIQWFSAFKVHVNHLETLLSCRMGASRFYNNSHTMLMLLVQRNSPWTFLWMARLESGSSVNLCPGSYL